MYNSFGKLVATERPINVSQFDFESTIEQRDFLGESELAEAIADSSNNLQNLVLKKKSLDNLKV